MTDGEKGLFAGDCLNSNNFVSDYGSVDYNCGSNCYARYTGDYGSYSSETSYGSEYSYTYGDYGSGCYSDDYECLMAYVYCDKDT